MSTEKAVSPQGLAGAKAVAIGEDDGLILFHAAGIATRSVSTVEEAEKALDIDALMAEALAGVRRRSIS